MKALVFVLIRLLDIEMKNLSTTCPMMYGCERKENIVQDQWRVETDDCEQYLVVVVRHQSNMRHLQI
jgi:hypothetical protein